MLLKAMLSNKTKLKKLIISVMQPPNTDNKENIGILISRIKGKKYHGTDLIYTIAHCSMLFPTVGWLTTSA